jgi:antitoxin MazE
MAAVRAQLVKWGNSHAVRLPKSILDQARIKEGQELDVCVQDGRIALVPVSPKLTLEALVADITPENMHGEQDWGKPVGNEPW